MGWLQKVVVSLGFAVVTAVVSGADRDADPLLGQWSGSWSYPTGLEEQVGTFRLDFARRGSRVIGSHTPLSRKTVRMERKAEGSDELVEVTEVEEVRPRTERVRRLTRTAIHPSAYRFEAEGYCWNLVIEGERLSGVRNGGTCTASGVGAGARPIEVVATRVAVVAK